MIEIAMNPVALQIGSLSIRWYSIMTALAALFAVVWAVRAARKSGFPIDLVYTLAIWAVVGGIVGARLVHVVDELNYYWQNPGEIIGFEGLAIYGAILGATLAIWIASRFHRFSFSVFADMVAPGALVAQAIGRVGCTINGCCYGNETTLPWALVYTHPDSFAPLGVPTEPAVVYELLFDIILFMIVLKLRGKLRPAGSLFLVYIAAYSVGRFFLASARDPNSQGPLFFGWLMQAQIISVIVALVAIPLLVTRVRWNKAELVTPVAGAADQPSGNSVNDGSTSGS